MKKKKSKLKTTIIILSVILFVISGFIIYSVFFKNSNYKSDSDTGFYSARYMKYNNGILTVKDPYGSYIDTHYIDTYELNEGKKYRTDIPDSLKDTTCIKYDDKFIYTDSVMIEVPREIEMSGLGYIGYLHMYDTDDSSDEIIYENYGVVIFCRDCVVYTNDETQVCYVYDVKTGNSEVLYEKLEGDYFEYYVRNEYFYVIRTVDKTESYITIFDLKTKTMQADFKIDEVIIDNSGEYPPKVNDYVINANGDEIIIHPTVNFRNLKFYDFNGKSTTSNLESSDIPRAELSAYNGDYKYYSVRDNTTSMFYDRTQFNPTNGLYMTNVKTGETTKLSNDCRYDGLLATENYLYCYTINRIIPEDIIRDMPVTGYTLTQIPVNKYK